jgi:hypothetical protein
LVEPKQGVKSEFFVDHVWHTVEHASPQAPGHARFTKLMFKVASPDMPFERAGKGTLYGIQQPRNYIGNIIKLYLGANTQRKANGLALAVKEHIEATHRFIPACTNVSFPMSNIKNDDDLYVLGSDFLKTIEISRVLKDGLGAPVTSWLTSQILYSYPTFSELSKTIDGNLSPDTASAGEGNYPNSTREIMMAKLV